MVYLVSDNYNLFSNFKRVSVEESLRLLESINVVGVDTETSQLECHTGTLLTLQLGNKQIQVVVDCTSVDVKLYKHYLESDRLFIFHNAKFDLKWLYKHRIVPNKIYDTFIAEKVLNLGLNTKCSLQAVADKYLGVYIDKSIRGDIITNGLSEEVIAYAAKDVIYLEDIMLKQKELIDYRGQDFAIRMECAFTPVLAYIEFCGIRLDVDKWKYKMSLDEEALCKSEDTLNNWVIDYCSKKGNIPIDIWNKGKAKTKYPLGVYAVQSQPMLFEELEEPIKCILNWNSSNQLIPLFEELGFNVWTKDKKTGISKKSADTRLISLQKDISDIVNPYKEYSASKKRTSAFGQNYLDAINFKTKRLHAEFNQLISSGRMSCGKGNYESEDSDNDKSINIQQLPNDHLTRECFIAHDGYKIIASDYGDQEGHMFAELADDKAWIDFYNDPAIRDGHSFVAKMIFKEELSDIKESDVKKIRPDLRQKAKAPRFTFNYKGTPKALQANTGLPIEECEKMFDNYFSAFSGIKKYFEKQEKEMWERGYILISEISNMRSYIPYWSEFKWLDDNKNKYSNIWDYYKTGKDLYYKGKLQEIKIPILLDAINLLKDNKSLEVMAYTLGYDINAIVYFLLKYLFKMKSSYSNKSANMPSQGTSGHMSKIAAIKYFNSIKERGLLFKHLIINIVHDEILIEVPENKAQEEANILQQCMEDSAKIFCKKLSIKAVPEIGDYWIH